jgi:hypothetical protein
MKETQVKRTQTLLRDRDLMFAMVRADRVNEDSTSETKADPAAGLRPGVRFGPYRQCKRKQHK